MIVALAGGVGGAKLAQGLYGAVPLNTLTVVVNTGDDFDLWGLRICPDADTVMYTLAGIANPATGWGVIDESWQTLAQLTRYGYDPWFRVGDRDFATHIARTEQLRAGRTLSQVFAALAAADERLAGRDVGRNARRTASVSRLLRATATSRCSRWDSTRRH